MDERARAWLALLPPSATIQPWRTPAEWAPLLADRTGSAPDVWLGYAPTLADLPDLSRYGAAVLVNGRGVRRSALAARGFTHIRAFAVVPSLGDARWFIPLESRHAATQAWNLYTPYQWRAAAQKRGAHLLAQLGLAAHMGDRVVVAQRAPSALEHTLAQVLGVSRFQLAIATGTPGPQRKLTLQVTAPNGDVLAYVKLAERPAAATLVQREAQFLDDLHAAQFQAGAVPRVRYHHAHGSGYVMVSEPLASTFAPSTPTLGRAHRAVLGELARHAGDQSNGALLLQLRRRMDALAGRIDYRWRERLVRTVARLSTLPAELATALSHGDFAPWNLRVDRRSDRLALLDWEHGRRSQFLLWDAFHFHTMVNSLVRRCANRASVDATLDATLHLPLVRALQLSAAHVRLLYGAYLADASVQWFEQYSATVAAHTLMTRDQTARGNLLDAYVEHIPEETWQSCVVS